MTRSLAGAPKEQPSIPDSVRAAAERFGGHARCVWLNQAGGSTWQVDGYFMKWKPRDSLESLGEEYQRMRWLLPRFSCPEPIEFEALDDGELLITRALAGSGAVTDTWLAQPETAVRAIAEGLRRLHSLETFDCPFMTDLPASADDDLVLSHGDACAPNTILDAHGNFLGLVDLARLGLADRWFDLTIAAQSLGWNYGEGYEPLFYATYGIEPNAARIRYWQRWWRENT